MPHSSDQDAVGLSCHYRVISHGTQPGHDAVHVAARLADLFKRSVDQMHTLLEAPYAIIKKQLDYASAQQFQHALDLCGCACRIEADGQDFSGLTLQRFTSPGIGIVLNAPASWRDSVEGNVYQLHDPQTNTEVSAIGVVNTSLTLPEWHELRMRKVAEEMPWLAQVRRPYRMEGADWGKRVQAVAAEYRGVFPCSSIPSHFLVLSLWTRQALVCLTINASTSVFEANDALYRWLLQTQLAMQESPAAPLHDEAMARWLKYNKAVA